jgi:soluble P-type ATPase
MPLFMAEREAHMLTITIPPDPPLQLTHLVLDYNGTLAYDGILLEGVKPRLATLAQQLSLHVLTADTFGSADQELTDIPCQLFILPAANQAEGKLHYIERLGLTQTVCIGNGRNDHLMLKAAALGIVVLQAEGMAPETLLAADVVMPSIGAALDVLLKPLRLIATLRN